MSLSKSKNSSRLSVLKGIDPFGLDTIKKEEKPTPANKTFKPIDKMLTRNDKTILSAGKGKIKDNIGPRKQMGSVTGNSIWDPDKISLLSEQKSNDEKTSEEKSEGKRLRKGLEAGRLNEMAESLKDADRSKVATVSSMSSRVERSGKDPSMKNKISIFDSVEGKNDFNNIPEKTAGESLTGIKDRKKEDITWHGIKGSDSTKKRVSAFFERLTAKG
jgi:hypothetical protein